MVAADASIPMNGKHTTEPTGEIANISPPPFVAKPMYPGAHFET